MEEEKRLTFSMVCETRMLATPSSLRRALPARDSREEHCGNS